MLTPAGGGEGVSVPPGLPAEPGSRGQTGDVWGQVLRGSQALQPRVPGDVETCVKLKE